MAKHEIGVIDVLAMAISSLAASAQDPQLLKDFVFFLNNFGEQKGLRPEARLLLQTLIKHAALSTEALEKLRETEH